MRPLSALFLAVSACSGAAPAVRSAPPSAPPPPASARAPNAPLNTTGLTLENSLSPISEAVLRFSAPSAGERIPLGDARRYDVRWTSERLDPDALGVDVALDAYRPRRLPASQSVITLGLLAPVGEELSAGEHWLFAAPISSSGLVPRRAPGAPRSAVAVRFRVGDAAPGPAAAGGVVWLRKPEGTYNGSSSERVLFDAHAFTASGAPLSAACLIHVRGRVSGELGLPEPFSVLALPSGEYELSASAPGAALASTQLVTVNSELGRPK